MDPNESSRELSAAIKLERSASQIYDVIATTVKFNGGWNEFCERLNECHRILVDEASSLREIAAQKAIKLANTSNTSTRFRS